MIVANTPEIETKRFWTSDLVRTACIRNDLYTRGTNEDYSNMLNYVDTAAEGPSLKNLYNVARDIYEHSREQTLTNIMFILENETVITTFRIEGRDDI